MLGAKVLGARPPEAERVHKDMGASLGLGERGEQLPTPYPEEALLLRWLGIFFIWAKWPLRVRENAHL